MYLLIPQDRKENGPWAIDDINEAEIFAES